MAGLAVINQIYSAIINPYGCFIYNVMPSSRASRTIVISCDNFLNSFGV